MFVTGWKASPVAGPQAEPGVLLSSTALVGACGGNYSAMTSVVYSPDFPDTYATGRVCYWTIRVPGASHIHFNFTLFDIRDSADMVELLDGYTHRVLVRFNGRNRPPLSFNVSLDFVILYFFSDRINQAQGFAVLYQGKPSWPPGGPQGPCAPAPLAPLRPADLGHFLLGGLRVRSC